MDLSTHKSFFQTDGFSNPQQSNDSNDKNCYLYKLHGSLNWIPHNGKIYQRESEEKVTEGTNFVIYPTLSPKNYEGDPYKTMWKKFQERIKKTDVFIVIGCSFRDELVNSEFRKFLRRDKTKMFVISLDDINTHEAFSDEKFTYNSLNVDHIQNNIQQYQELCNLLSRSNIISDELEVILQECLPGFYDTDDKVYNLVGRLEDVDGLDLLNTLQTILYIQFMAKNQSL